MSLLGEPSHQEQPKALTAGLVGAFNLEDGRGFFMGTQIKLLITLTSFFLNAFAYAGPRTDGGGFVPGGTYESAISFAMEQAPENLRDYLLKDKKIDQANFPSSPVTDEIWKKMFGSSKVTENSPVYKQLGKVKFEFPYQKPCFGEEGEVDASTSHKLDAPICVSTIKLKRLSESSLNQNLMALLMHELAHQFGADEYQAGVIQRYFAARFENFSNVSPTECFSRVFDRSDYFNFMAKIAIEKVKKGSLDIIAAGMTAEQVLDFSSYSPWLVDELKTDSLLSEQLVTTIDDLKLRTNYLSNRQFEWYTAANGMTCMKFLFKPEQLIFESARVIEKNENVQIVEIKFNFFTQREERRYDYETKDLFSMLLEIRPDRDGTFLARVKSYPQFLSTKTTDEWMGK